MKNQEGKTPFHSICENSNCNEEILRFFFDNNTQVNTQDNEGKSCLHYALEKELSEEVVKYLIQNKAGKK